MLKSKFIIPKRKIDSHKGDFGKILIIAGSSGMLGAGVLASRGALRSGAGLVYWAVPTDLINTANLSTPEVIVSSYEEMWDLKSDVVAIGPGLSSSDLASRITHNALHNFSHPLVIDADALNILSNNPEMLRKLPSTCVLTPHPGEMSRLTGIAVEDIQTNREQIAKDFSKKWNSTIVLKGNKTVVADPLGEVYINETGNPGMASAGMGDVLTGIIASFIGQDFPIFESICTAVYIHGLAGDLAAKEIGEYGIVASDLILKIPEAIQRAQNGI